VPTFNFEALYHWKKAGMDFSLFNKFTGKQPGVYIANSSELRSNYMSAYNIMDLSFSKYFLDRTIGITLGGKNLFNVTNISASGQFNSSGVHSTATQSLPVGWGASFFASLHLNLGSSMFHKKEHGS
jgi:outer membrane receptor for ferrienterochelin and colicins